MNKFLFTFFVTFFLNTSIFSLSAEAYPVFAQQGYENPSDREKKMENTFVPDVFWSKDRVKKMSNSKI